eukprot:m.225248 g.225248  ORF g.225248 m.225248 type:complete len:342 (+) comp19202_c0_seq4:203-1228(+)
MAFMQQEKSLNAHQLGVISSSRLQDDVNAGYIDYETYDMPLGCRPCDSSEDEDELNVDLHFAEHAAKQTQGEFGTEGQADDDAAMGDAQQAPKGAAEYDAVYFDSDDEQDAPNGMHANSSRTFSEDKESNVPSDTTTADSKQHRKETKARKRTARTVESNDALFYDPDIDDENQRWVDEQRTKHYSQTTKSTASAGGSTASNMSMPPGAPRADFEGETDAEKAKSSNLRKGLAAAAHSDAVLNCPSCMTMLTLDCQRHEKFDQFRAMFVHNCVVDEGENLYFHTPQEKKKFRKKIERMEPNSVTALDEVFHPVSCSECDAVVAVIDEDEVYHFFNVLSSLP